MLNVSVGDTFTVNDENGAQRTIKVAGISEMYIGHFIFMNAQCYEHVFGDQYSTNAYMVRLKDHSNANTERQGAKFMKLAAVRASCRTRRRRTWCPQSWDRSTRSWKC